MKRININYGGVGYSVANRELDELKAEIETALAAGNAHWITVTGGEGTMRPVELLITPGVQIALTGIDADS